MTLQKQLRRGGLLIMVISVLLNGMNILVQLNFQNALIQAISGIGFTGLVLAASVIHIAQARRAGIFGLGAYLITSLSLVYANVVNFLTLAEFSGVAEARQTFLALWSPVLQMAVYGVFVGWTLLGVSAAQAGIFPRRAGILVALGAALQIPSQYAIEMAGPLAFLSTIGGSILFGAGLIWIGWALWSGKGWKPEEPGLSGLDRKWGGPVLVFAGLISAVDAMTNMLGGLSLLSGITHLLTYTTFVLIAFVLYAAHAGQVSWTGFAALLFTQIGAVLYVITAFLILAQLAGVIDNNHVLMASWVDIPVGRLGNYMTILGLFLFGVEAIRSGVFPRWSGWLVLIGIAIAIPFAFTVQDYFLGIFWVIGAVIEGVGLASMGVTLMIRKPVQRNVQFAESTS